MTTRRCSARINGVRVGPQGALGADSSSRLRRPLVTATRSAFLVSGDRRTRRKYTGEASVKRERGTKNKTQAGQTRDVLGSRIKTRRRMRVSVQTRDGRVFGGGFEAGARLGARHPARGHVVPLRGHGAWGAGSLSTCGAMPRPHLMAPPDACPWGHARTGTLRRPGGKRCISAPRAQELTQ